MRRHHHTSPADPDRLDVGDFWAGTADWPTSEVPAVTPVGHDDPYRDVDEAIPADADLVAVEELFDDERWDADWAPAPQRPAGIDPLVLRVGAIVVALTLAVPLLLGLRSDSDEPASIETDAAASAATDPDTATTPAEAEPGDADEALTPDAQADQIETAAEPSDPSATDAADPDGTTAAVCGTDYQVVEGDFWIRIADGADVELSALLDVNDATVDSPLYPGSTICLPEGAATPAPPVALDASGATTGAVSSGATASASAEPVPSPRPAPAPAPTTTAPTTTAPPPPPPPAPAGDVVSIIRSVWPDDLEERAITIAWRESNHRPDVYNGSCCYGLFQIYYDVHKSWLASDLGITSAQQLFDPVLNARAAYRLYERAGGWGPWAQTNY